MPRMLYAGCLGIALVLSWATVGASLSLGQQIVNPDGEVAQMGPDIDCDGTGTDVHSRVDTAVAAAASPGEVKICPGTSGSDQDIHITTNMLIETIGSGAATVQSQSDDGDQGPTILIEETSGEEITKVEIKGLDVEHMSSGGNTNAATIDMQGGVENVELKNMTVSRGGIWRIRARQFGPTARI